MKIDEFKRELRSTLERTCAEKGWKFDNAKAYKFGVDVDDNGLWHSDLGHDGIQLMREATYWWRRQLLKIERDVSPQ